MSERRIEPKETPPGGCEDCGEIFWSEDEQENHDCPENEEGDA